MPEPQVDIDTIKEITDEFIEAGIHMDAVNVEGLTAAQICTSRKYPAYPSLSLINSIFHGFSNVRFGVRFFLSLSLPFRYSIHSSATAAI